MHVKPPYISVIYVNVNVLVRETAKLYVLCSINIKSLIHNVYISYC
jgi:hypothetical protein